MKTNRTHVRQTVGRRRLPIAGVMFASVLLLPQQAWAGNSVTQWMEQALQTVRQRNVGTPNAGRLYAMVAVAIYDAVNGIDTVRHHGHEAAIVPATNAPIQGNRDAAVAAAAHAVLVGLVPAQASILDAALAADLAALGASDKPTVYGRQWGAYVGQEVLAARSADGTQFAVNMPAGTAPGEHRAVFDARFRNGIRQVGKPPHQWPVAAGGIGHRAPLRKGRIPVSIVRAPLISHGRPALGYLACCRAPLHPGFCRQPRRKRIWTWKR